MPVDDSRLIPIAPLHQSASGQVGKSAPETVLSVSYRHVGYLMGKPRGTVPSGNAGNIAISFRS